MRFSGIFEAQMARSFAGLRRALLAVAAIALVGPAANSQAISADQLQQLQQQRAGTPMTTQPSVTSRDTILEPTAPPAMLPASPLETLLSTRAGVLLKQFGYDQLGVGRAVHLPQVGAVQDDYVLGAGDEVVLTLRGQENAEYRSEVNRDGNITFPKLYPISAAGRSFGQLRQDLLAAIHRAYVSTEGFITVGKIRQITVLVSGEVGSPGVRTLTGLSTVSDALFVSGGVRKSGSLRNIRVLRGGRVLTVDLYSILIGGIQSRNITLANGDKVIVPPIGNTVAIAGETRRSGIYELPAGRTSIRITEAVALAGGTVIRGTYATSLLRTGADGRRQFLDVTSAPATGVGDGEVVFVKSAVNISLNQVTLSGSVRSPGLFALNRYPTLHDLLPTVEALSPQTYMLMGIIDRTDPKTMQRVVVPFSPLRVVQGKENVTLVSNDIVRVLTKDQMRALIPAELRQQETRVALAGAIARSSSAAVESRSTAISASKVGDNGDETLTKRMDSDVSQNAGANQIAGAGQNAGASQNFGTSQNSGMDQNSGANQNSVLNQNPSVNQNEQLRNAIMFSKSERATAAEEAAASATTGMTKAEIDYFGRVISSYRVNVGGAVYNPGYYLAAPGTTLADVVMAAGGLTKNVDLSALELTSTVVENQTGSSTTSRQRFAAAPEAMANYIVKPMDDVFFREVYFQAEAGAFVVLKGEVRNPGTYSILRNERLSSVIERAGGLTPQAYPYGAVFTRLSTAERERSENSRSANDIRSQILNSVTRASSAGQGMTGEAITAIMALLSQMEAQPAVGRVSVIPDPAVLQENRSMDLLLEGGDTIVVPKRPSTVSVLGEVLQPGTFVWNKSNDVSDYVDQAGGPTEYADTSRITVILPDGSARSAGMSWLSIGLNGDVPAGSTIVVFRDVSSLSSHQLIVEVTSIVSSLASTAAAMAVLNKY